MAFDFLCPSCQSKLRAPEKLIGAELRCPKCAVTIEVPAPEGALAATPEEIETAPATSPAPPIEPEQLEAKVAEVTLGKRASVEAEMDMTPMVDVTFLLLIFFMITAAFALQKALDTPTPKKDEASTQAQLDPEDDPESVVVKIDANNTYYVIAEDWEEEAPSKHDLIAKLRQAKDGASSGVVPDTLFIRAHPEAMHKTVVAALDAGQAVGLEKVKLQTSEGDED